MSGIVAYKGSYEEAVERLNEVLALMPNARTYVETLHIEKPEIKKAIKPLPQTFDLIKLFSEEAELTIKRMNKSDSYQIVWTSDVMEWLPDAFLPLQKTVSRSFYWGQGKEKLDIQVYSSKESGEFTRWKGVSK